MGVFLSISNSSNELTRSQKLFRLTESNEIIVDPADFQTFIKTFRSLQCKKEDNQIDLRNLVLEWKSHLKGNLNTQDIRSQAYELIDTIENLHDEQDILLEGEKKKLELMAREVATNNSAGSHHHVGLAMNDQSNSLLGGGGLKGTSGEQSTKGGDFTDMHKEISRRQQYLQMFNNQSTIALKRALLDIEACRKMVDYSKDFVDNSEEISSSEESSEEPFPHPV
ncbi:uncharacterized protein LOC114519068 [Dendronephthya gigantea]|uniref:uncharacterized protein LOC114519068 n=1 Tax=Dendronephthya gigantea TaxID=151771 RepID=UPI00106971ED|nr:uncharacterized protein LOC114519068 [Dendronephthya gigantea]